MEKFIMHWSYWSGIVALLLALLARAVDVIAPEINFIPTKGEDISYRTFMSGAFLFFATTIATASYTWFNSRGPQAHGGEQARKEHERQMEEVVGNLVESARVESSRH